MKGTGVSSTYVNQVHSQDLSSDISGVRCLAVVPVGRKALLVVEEVVALCVLAGTEERHHGL